MPSFVLMTITARPYTPDDLAAVHGLYTDLTVGRVPHCWSVAPEVLAAALETPDADGPDASQLTAQAVLVAGDGDGLSGFVHLGIQPAKDDGAPQPGVIRFLAYRRGQRAIGDALLAAGEAWLRNREAKSAVSLPQQWRYPFYGFSHAYLSDHLDHVQALFRCRGYERVGGEVFMDWLDMDPHPVADPDRPDFELRVEERPGAGRLPGLRLQVVHGDEGFGECVLVSGGECSANEEAQAFVFCDWLGVQEPWQGHGIGRFLLNRGLCAARERGYRHGAISTAFHNDRAFLFYTNHGFRVVDWTYKFERALT